MTDTRLTRWEGNRATQDRSTPRCRPTRLPPALTDYQIQPDPGSVNPWQYPPGHHRGRDANKFTVTLQSDVTPGQANVLALAAAGTRPGAVGYLQYRVYLPVGGDMARVPLTTC
jgi:hypothetical protein